MTNAESQASEHIAPIQFLGMDHLKEIPAPFVRITTCGLLSFAILKEVVSTDPPQARYQVLTPEQLHGRGPAPALMLLKLLVSRPQRFALRDWLLHQFCHERELFSNVRLDNIASQLRSLLCPETYEGLRTRLVAHARSRSDSGDGFQLASYPLIWIDHEALAWNVEQAARMERFDDDPLPFWERAYALAKGGDYLPDELYSDWATERREEVAGMRKQCVRALARLYQERHGKAGEEEALLLLRSYWHEHPREEDVLRPLMELLARHDCYQEALDSYERLCTLLKEEDRQPDPHTQDVITFVRTKQIQRRPSHRSSVGPSGIPPAHSSIFPEGNTASPQTLAFSPDQNGIIQDMTRFFEERELDADRRRFLQQLFLLAGAAALPSGSLHAFTSHEYASTEMLTLYEHILTLSWEQYYTSSARYAARHVAQWIQSLTALLPLAHPEEQQQLLSLLCRFYQLSGVAARDRMDLTQACHDGKLAIELAFYLEQAELIAASLFRQAKTLIKYERSQEALEHLEAAGTYAQRARAPLKGYVYQATAEAYALADSGEETRQQHALHLLDRAEHVLETGNGEDDGSFVKLNRAGISLDRAGAFIRFQRFHEAHLTLENARVHLGADFPRWQTRLLLAEAQAHLAEQSPEGCCEKALKALHILRATQSQSGFQRITSLYRQVAEMYPQHLMVQKLGEQLAEQK